MDINKIQMRINELHAYFGDDVYISFHLLQLFVLTKILIDYLEKGVEPADFQWCFEEKREPLEDYI